MSKLREYLKLTLTLAICAGFIAVIWLVTDSLGAWDVYKAQQATRAAEARAAALQAEAEALAARRELWTSGALVFASVKDSLLVTFAFLCNSALLAVVVVIVIWQRGNRESEGESNGR